MAASMAANKFATMLHRNTHKITVTLVYAVLEWVLIFLLLLNSLFAFLITKFAFFFGLKPPCPWCTRVDHILQPDQSTHSYRDLACEAHATEISKLGYCPNHHKLTESQTLCLDCLSPRPELNEKSTQMPPKIAFFTWVSEKQMDNAEMNSRCCCCDESLSSKVHPTYLLLKPNWEVLRYAQKGNLITETMDEESNGGEYSDHSSNGLDVEQNGVKGEEVEGEECGEDDHQIHSDVASFSFGAIAEKDCLTSVSNIQCEANEVGNRAEKTDIEHKSLQLMNPPPLDASYCDFDRLVPIELIDSSITASQRLYTCRDQEDGVGMLAHLYGGFNSEPVIEARIKLLAQEKADNSRHGKIERLETADNENSLLVVAGQNLKDSVAGTYEQLVFTQVSPTSCTIDKIVQKPNMRDAENLQGVEVSDHEPTNQTQAKEPTATWPFWQLDQSSTIFGAPMLENDKGPKQFEATIQKRNVLVGKKHEIEGIHQHLCTHLETDKVEEDKFSETSIDIDDLRKKLLLFEKRELGTEDSWDGSVASEMEGGDEASTIERLNSALRAQRKALSALYAELEEERSAAAIATNQTMAMITRIQEEKAAMQMEALQYQRMMEEQSEYDQEALQLLNELMIKREKEKQELEKELEMYRKKVLQYEAKETMVGRKGGSLRSRVSSASCSNAEDSDELSIDLNLEGSDENSSICGQQEIGNSNTPADTVPSLGEMDIDCVKHVSTLDASMTDFEEERLSILEELKALEEKLFTLGADEDHLFEDVRPIDQFTYVHSKEFCENYDFSSPEETAVSNVFSGDLNGKHYPDNNTMDSKAKMLLPLLDANETESGEVESNEEQNKSDSTEYHDSKFLLESPKLPIEEEVDHIYERLQALESHREFLKHCVSSLKRGDEGMELLQEILQHLRNLRTVELRVRNMGNSPLL